MWIMTKYGFFSAVSARQGDGGEKNAPDPTRMMVRARAIEHLHNLIDRFPEQLSDCEPYESETTDYPCRIFVAKDVWCDIVERMTSEVAYDNFKSEVHAAGLTDARYSQALSSVWGVMHRVSAPARQAAGSPFYQPDLFDPLGDF